ncbi:GFA family protein [Vibrio sp. T187]|uniref:GFA family protein n=1 Tax=Vibrio TaxID=662 RepID=UPI0010C99764|nr:MULTISPECIES: GFA family protein [Vibrio]MBW3695193.1 GFA family protein [Vibrio sp. T187]
MPDSNQASASCLCGKVTATAKDINPKFTVCHCKMCRTWGGSPLMAVQCGTQVSFEGADFIKEYDSSDWAKRGFCSNCGTHLFYRVKASGSYNMPLGLFPEMENLSMTMQYFIDKKPSHYCFSNETKEMTEEEIFAYFASQM